MGGEGEGVNWGGRALTGTRSIFSAENEWVGVWILGASVDYFLHFYMTVNLLIFN